VENIQKTDIVNFAAATSKVLGIAFWRKSPKIAEQFTELGKPMGSRAARKMTEESADVTRRNILENTILLLGASYRTSRKTFDIIWLFLESFADALRGNMKFCRTRDEQFAEFRFAAAAAERAYFKGEKEEMIKSLIFVDHSLKGLFARLFVID